MPRQARGDAGRLEALGACAPCAPCAPCVPCASRTREQTPKTVLLEAQCPWLQVRHHPPPKMQTLGQPRHSLLHGTRDPTGNQGAGLVQRAERAEVGTWEPVPWGLEGGGPPVRPRPATEQNPSSPSLPCPLLPSERWREPVSATKTVGGGVSAGIHTLRQGCGFRATEECPQTRARDMQAHGREPQVHGQVQWALGGRVSMC